MVFYAPLNGAVLVGVVVLESPGRVWLVWRWVKSGRVCCCLVNQEGKKDL